MKKRVALLLCLLLILSLLGACSKSSMNTTASNGDYAAAETYGETYAEAYDKAYTEEGAAVNTAAGALEATGDQQITSLTDAKIIYSADLSLESTEFDQAIASIDATVKELSGYIQSSSINGDSLYNADGTTSIINRYASYQIAIPSESFEIFLQRSGGIGNVISQSRQAENISSQYTDTEARIESLQTQYDRLMAMLEKATDVDTLVALEARLSEVTYELESYERTLRNWDRQVAYSTIHLYVQEVSLYTQTATVTRSFGQRLSDALSDGWNSFVRGTQNLAVSLVGSLPALLLLAVLILVAVIVVRIVIKRRRVKKAAKKEVPPEDPAQ